MNVLSSEEIDTTFFTFLEGQHKASSSLYVKPFKIKLFFFLPKYSPSTSKPHSVRPLELELVFTVSRQAIPSSSTCTRARVEVEVMVIETTVVTRKGADEVVVGVAAGPVEVDIEEPPAKVGWNLNRVVTT